MAQLQTPRFLTSDHRRSPDDRGLLFDRKLAQQGHDDASAYRVEGGRLIRENDTRVMFG
jgi:hypothetical protein